MGEWNGVLGGLLAPWLQGALHIWVCHICQNIVVLRFLFVLRDQLLDVSKHHVLFVRFWAHVLFVGVNINFFDLNLVLANISIYFLLQTIKMRLKVFVDFTHIQVKLFIIALCRIHAFLRCSLALGLQLLHLEKFFFCAQILIWNFNKLYFELIEALQLISLDLIKCLF